MERLLEKSLDDQYAIEQTRQAAEALLNRRLNWVMLPLGIAFAVIAYCLDMSTRIALPVLAELQEASPLNDARHDYDVFRLDLWAFARMVPSALIAGAIGSWFAVLMGTKYGRNQVVVMYALVGLLYAAVFTAILGILILLNVMIFDKLGLAVTDSQIPFSNEITSFGSTPALFPLTHLVTGMERGMWAGVSVIVLLLVVVRLSRGVSSLAGQSRSMILSTVVGAVVVGTLLFGPLGFQQYLFDRFVQPPSSSILGFEADGDSTTPLP